MMKIPTVKVIPEFTQFIGGLDLETPPLFLSPGTLIGCLNYEPATNGGYQRIDGYERFDGRPSPSDADYYYCNVSLTATVNVGDIIEGDTSGATGEVILINSTYLDITKVTGDFQVEDILVGGNPVGSIIATPSLNGEPTGLGSATASNAAADVYRADISAPAGSGPIRGIAILKGEIYCFRDNVGATAGLIYEATSSGWSEVTLYHELSFDTGVGLIEDGDAITQVTSGATADVKRVVLESGAWGSDAAGRLILDNITGTFDNTNDLQVASVTQATSTSTADQITILPGGRYETIVYNFGGTTDTLRLYGADGVNRGFEFDGDTYVPIDVPISPNTPEYVYGHKQQLFFSFQSSSLSSGIGTPYEWTAIAGATEIAFGDDITGYADLPGQALAIAARNITNQLLGNNSDDFVLDSISNEMGAIPRTIQRMGGQVFALDDRGIISVSQTDAYGNFDQSAISWKIQPLIESMRQVVIASVIYRQKNQYRLYGSDGTGICMTLMDRGDVTFTEFSYPDNVACTIAGEDSTGKNIVFFGSDEGMVYQADKGSSFDGEDIEAFSLLSFNNSGSPTMLKTYRRAIIEMTSESYSNMQFSVDFSYADPNVSAQSPITEGVTSAGAFWGAGTWDEFFYDNAVVANPSFHINGTGTNLALIIYSNSDIDLGHKLSSATIHYTPRRIQR